MDITQEYKILVTNSDMPTTGSYAYKFGTALLTRFNATFETGFTLQSASNVYRFSSDSTTTPTRYTANSIYYFPLFDSDGSVSNDLFIGIASNSTNECFIFLCTPRVENGATNLYMAFPVIRSSSTSSNIYANYDMYYGTQRREVFYRLATVVNSNLKFCLSFSPLNNCGYIITASSGMPSGNYDPINTTSSDAQLIVKSIDKNGAIRTSVLYPTLGGEYLYLFTPWKSHHYTSIRLYRSDMEYDGLTNDENYVIATNIFASTIVDSKVYAVFMPLSSIQDGDISKVFKANTYNGVESLPIKDTLRYNDELYSIVPYYYNQNGVEQTFSAFAIKQ